MRYRDDDPPDYPEPPECCDEIMDVAEDGTCKCLTCGKVIEPEPDWEPPAPWVLAYHLPDDVPIRRNNIHTAEIDGERDVDDWLRMKHPNQRVIIRYVIRKTEQQQQPPPGFYDINSHLWRELLPCDEEDCGPEQCPHGKPWGSCDACDHLSDIAYDAARENRYR